MGTILLILALIKTILILVASSMCFLLAQDIYKDKEGAMGHMFAVFGSLLFVVLVSELHTLLVALGLS